MPRRRNTSQVRVVSAKLPALIVLICLSFLAGCQGHHKSGGPKLLSRAKAIETAVAYLQKQKELPTKFEAAAKPFLLPTTSPGTHGWRVKVYPQDAKKGHYKEVFLREDGEQWHPPS